MFSSLIVLRIEACLHSLLKMRGWGAAKKELKAMVDITITIHGPVGMDGATKDICAPAIPLIAPNTLARRIIARMLCVQRRAAAAGVMRIAALSTTPAA